jgi:hypothetical protein
MSRRPSTFRQSDLTRALKAARKAGVEVERVEIGQDGKMVVVLSREGSHQERERNVNEWDTEE